MAKPARYDFSAKRRADCILRLQLKDGLKQPINLASHEVEAQVWDQARTVKHADFTVYYVNRTIGRIDLRLFPQETELLPSDSWYDVRLTEPSGIKSYPLEGIIYAQEGYTEDA